MVIPKFRYLSLSEANRAKGAVVVIDVLRAFTTAAYAFASGALGIMPVGTVDEAIALKKCMKNALIMGEVNGHMPKGFDFSNSPFEISNVDLSGKRLIQRTTAGTQGIVRAKNAQILLAASFVVASATASYLQEITPELITFVVTGQSLGRDGEEDRACAEYIEALVRGDAPDPVAYTDRVLTSNEGRAFSSGGLGYMPPQDFNLCLESNRFGFCLAIKTENGRLVMESR